VGDGAGPVLVVNAGSSTLKLALLAGSDDEPVAATTIDQWDGRDTSAIASFIADRDIGAVGHRVVHGGERFTEAVVLDDEIEDAISDLTALAPLHQPGALAGIAAARQVVPDAPHVACFDTAFHATMPAAASTYAVPAAWREQRGVRRFGFHGLSHAYAATRAAALLGRDVESLALVTCHLGAGASLCAVDGGRSVDTTMGFTPVEGLVMATRSGTVDPGLLVWLLRQGVGLDELDEGLERKGGLLAIAGTGDMREVLARRAKRDNDATLAFDVYVHQLARYVFAMTAALGRLDALVFTGGVGERAAPVRAAVSERAVALGVALDPAANDAATGDAVIGTAAVVVTAREDLEIAAQVRTLLSA